ncbi:hypothetical protein CROQUDRAFT_479078 [Cronartium quercuum f. sp. fusiforme G11]|uniref:Pep3/Vps18/deep orange domain-containing protein n=1 Tax=Cronartium quercuum f. sp. fusiforme G11 TaxID=708437 RepID=A0A9P6NHS4_9BASI|nr:hypothetical protein CROQUDRAFT_479078 [Cronartium quercuum f. sp. fusiforme G11]
MATFEDFVNRSGITGQFSATAGNASKQLSTKGFEDPSEAALVDLRARRRQAVEAGHGVVEFDPYPPKPIEPGIFSLGRVQFSLDEPLQVLLCNSHVLLFLLLPPTPTSSNPPRLVRIDLAQPSVVDTIDLPIPALLQTINQPRSQQLGPNSIIHRVHCDPTGRHVLISLLSGDNFYVSLSPTAINQQRAAVQVAARRGGTLTTLGPAIKPLLKFRGLVITAIGWHPSSYNGVPAASTKEIILGTTTGALFATLLIDHHSQESTSDLSITAAFSRTDRTTPDRFLKLLYTLPESTDPQAISGIYWDSWCQFAPNKKGIRRALAIVTTSSRIHQFVDQVGILKSKRDEDESDSLLERLFASYNSNRVMPKSLELPVQVHSSELHVYQPSRSPTSEDNDDLNGSAPLISWLTGAGIYHGEIAYGSQDPGDSVILTTQLIPYRPIENLTNVSSTHLSAPKDTPVDCTVPLSLASTQYHFVLLYDDRIQVICRLDSRLVHEELLDLRPGEHIIALASDPVHHTYWLHSSESIFELIVKDEGRDIWKVFLSRNAFESALGHAKTSADRDAILIGQADHYFQTGKFISAAQIYAQCSKSFEEVVMGFIDRGERDALRYYLISRLERLKRNDLTQRMMLATWLTEIYLAKINELEDLAASGSSDEDTANLKVEQGMIEDELRQFLRTYKANLDQKTTYDLITSHGRKDVMIHYATLVGDFERIIRHHIHEDNWTQAIEALNRQDDLELYYRFAPILVRNEPRGATTAFMRQPKLDVRRLIPALIQPRSTKRTQSETNNCEIVIGYLKYAIARLDNTDAPVHNALLTLYATQPQEDEASLLRFLASTPDNPLTGKPYYDLDYALRVCKNNGKLQSCGLIYGKMGLYESSVDLALQTGDLELAKINADKPEDDPLLRKKLWLKIAKHVVHNKQDIKAAMNFLECTDLLKIEDILPFFPDFVVIDDFKEDICDALDHYSAHIQKLKSEMEESTRSADLIKSDIEKLSHRFLVINQTDNCNSCDELLLTRPFYVFPCQHSFHVDCLIKEVTQHMPPHQLRRMLTLQTKLSQAIPVIGEVGTARMIPGGADVLTLLSDSKRLAMASVQGLDQVRKLIIPDALVGVIGGSVGAIGSGVGALGGVLPLSRVAKLRLNNPSDQSPSPETASSPTDYGNAFPSSVIPTATHGSPPPKGLQPPSRPLLNKPNSSLSVKFNVGEKKSEMEKWKDELDELLASKCGLCEWALNSLDRPFVGEGEVDI